MSKVPLSNIHHPYGYPSTSYNPAYIIGPPPLPANPGIHHKPPEPSYQPGGSTILPPLPQSTRYPNDAVRYQPSGVGGYYPNKNNRSSNHFNQPFHQ